MNRVVCSNAFAQGVFQAEQNLRLARALGLTVEEKKKKRARDPWWEQEPCSHGSVRSEECWECVQNEF